MRFSLRPEGFGNRLEIFPILTYTLYGQQKFFACPSGVYARRWICIRSNLVDSFGSFTFESADYLFILLYLNKKPKLQTRTSWTCLILLKKFTISIYILNFDVLQQAILLIFIATTVYRIQKNVTSCKSQKK